MIGYRLADRERELHRSIQLHGEREIMTTDNERRGQVNLSLDQTEEANASSIPSETPRTRRVSVQLSETIFERLEAATGQPGAGKSMVVEEALERFLSPAPPVEGVVHEALHRIGDQIERLESELAIVAETVALHARYHLTVTPPMPPSQQRDACVLGYRRFKALAEQVDRRVRSGQPLMRETIARLGATERAVSPPESDGEAAPSRSEDQNEVLADVERNVESEQTAAVQEDGSHPNFRHLPNALC
ncbi:hypothetical protein QA640_14525 [Bradyrhizobium sp. CB82]|uniref:hypothetical protein n=1 Tax=Bradyrhizobium sp. CB82 TaxID=3039159 RepID=UPI0024B25D41|nr:hypothetical protein [Bradyrhizobium sp. CB82]WFU43552.1 hypothetical protein QA640_14525 [Bradyrhizobium sp. CB82]